MAIYDYPDAVKNDVLNYIKDEEVYEDLSLEDFQNLEGDAVNLSETLYDRLWDEDTVTGAGSGMYTTGSRESLDNLFGNFDLLADAADEGWDINSALRQGVDACDVLIRQSCLDDALTSALQETQPQFELAYANRIEDTIRGQIDNNTALSPEEQNAALDVLEEKMDAYPDEVIASFDSGELNASSCIAEGMVRQSEKGLDRAPVQQEKGR